MKLARKLVCLLLSVCMVFGYASVAGAVGGAPNVKMVVSSTTVNVGDEVSVTLSCDEHVVAGFGLFLEFNKDLLECTEVLGPDGDDYYYILYLNNKGREKEADPNVYDDVAGTNSDGIYSLGWVPGSDTTIVEQDLITLTFVAKAAGTVTFVLNEQTSGTDAFKGVAGTQTLTIKGNEPVCDHNGKTYTYTTNSDGTHKVTCECGEVVKAAENCSGGTATCNKLAKCEFCGNTYGSYAGHSYGDLIPAQTPVHTQDELKAGVDAHYICSECGKYFTEGKVETTLAALTGETPKHEVDPSKTKETTTDATCTEDGKVVTETFCSCGKLIERTEKPIPAGSDCVLGAAVYTWAADNSTCTAEVKCQHGTVHKSEKVNTTSKVTTVGTCLTEEVVTFTADFTADWAKDQTKTVTGKKNADNHVGEQTTTYTDNGADHTVTVTCECGVKISSGKEAHNYGDDFTCDNCFHMLRGWQQKGENWYYVDDNGGVATGNVRVPYPTVAINGVTYGPNAEDVAYAQAHEGSKYSDATSAVFVFDENGVFQSDFTGLIDGNRYAVNGVIAWHVGLVEINGEYYYFGGDENGGGNIMATGKVYAFRNTTGFEIVAGGIYYFGNDGKLCRYEGVVEIDGKKYYFDNGRLMIGAGVTEYDAGLIYVRSTGEIIVGRKYWITAEKSNGLCNVGMYSFDENGFMQTAKDPRLNGLVDGVYYENGMPCYAGLIEIDGDIYYINQEGKAVTGTYYITKVDNYTGSLEFKRGDKLTFGADGKLIID